MENKKYYLFEKNAHGGNSYKQYTLQELKRFFEPDTSIASIETVGEFLSIHTIEDLEDYVENFVNNNDGIHYCDYYIEEV